MANRRSCPGTGITSIMYNQQLTHQGLGSLRLLFGSIVLFVIWQQCRAWDIDRELDCGNIERPSKYQCRFGTSYYYSIQGACPNYYCHRGINETCDFETRQCKDELKCLDNRCMFCDNKDKCLMDNEKPNLPSQKRFPNKFFGWIHRPRSEKRPQKYLREPYYYDETMNNA